MAKLIDDITKIGNTVIDKAKKWHTQSSKSANTTSKNSALNYDEILEGQRNKLTDTKNIQQDVINKTHDSQATVLKEQYGQVIDDTNVAYESEYQKNAVQKLINEKKIAEKNANLGLTDSGLNRTQQTAAQLSYANQKGNIDISKRNALDTLSQNLASSLANIEQSRVTSLANLDTSIESQAQSNAYDIYKTNVEANTAMQKAAIEASMNGLGTNGGTYSNVLWYRTGTFDENGNPIFRNSEGKIQAFGAGYNPYTGTKHEDVKYGTFDGKTGYQPDNIKGVKVVAAKIKGSNGITAKINITGKTQTIWKCGDKYYLWRGDLNSYVECDPSDLSFELE